MQGLIPQYTTRFDIVDAHYWWCNDHHDGQWSREYERLCRIQRYFTPSRSANQLEGFIAVDIYNTLCDRQECMHDRLTYGDGEES